MLASRRLQGLVPTLDIEKLTESVPSARRFSLSFAPRRAERTLDRTGYFLRESRAAAAPAAISLRRAAGSFSARARPPLLARASIMRWRSLVGAGGAYTSGVSPSEILHTSAAHSLSPSGRHWPLGPLRHDHDGTSVMA